MIISIHLHPYTNYVANWFTDPVAAEYIANPTAYRSTLVAANPL